MDTKKKSKNITESKTQILWLFGIIPFMRIKHSVIIIPQEKSKNILRFRKMYRLFCFIPLFSTERDYEQ